jgi:hypothetical protein
MASSVSGWRQLLNSIESTGKYINLDLSACTMTGTSFNPDHTVATGKKYIVSIILPTVAISIEAAPYNNSSFNEFINLKSIVGTNIITIGDYSIQSDFRINGPENLKNVDFPNATTIGKSAFGDTYLENVNFPQVTTIGEFAFMSCRRLKTATFSKVQSIGESAFSFCSDLENISFPASAEIGISSGNYSNPFTSCKSITFTLNGSGSLSVIENGKALVRNNTILLAYPSASGTVTLNTITALDGNVFQSCYDLAIINLPQVTNVGSEAFSYCSNIQDVSFPQATVIGSSAFSSCSRLQSVTFPLVTAIGSSAFSSCSNLITVNIPNVTKIEQAAFSSTGNTNLSITMGSTRPTLGYRMFDYITTARTITVKVPAGATGYSPFTGTTSVTISGTNTIENWANGFRGGGWNGYAFDTGSTYLQGVNYINQSISLVIQQQ